ncbi:putative ankyrin repeat domain-containing protein 30B-like isoform X3 [Heliangelus exortis]
MMAVQFNRVSCVALLLQRGADPNLSDMSGNTALHLAVLFCDVSVVQLLLRRGASLDAENKEGFTPLSLAVSKGQAEIAEFLGKKAAGDQAQSPSEQVAEREAEKEEEAEHAGDPDDVVVLNTALWEEAFGSALDAAAVERGGRIFKSGGAQEEKDPGLFLRWFVLSALSVFPVAFSIRWSSRRSFVDVLICYTASCQAVSEGSCDSMSTGRVVVFPCPPDKTFSCPVIKHPAPSLRF